MDIPEKEICKRIRELRKRLKLTQEQFAAIVGLSNDCIGKIERGVSIPSLSTVQKITAAVKMPLSEFLVSEPEEHYGEMTSAISDLSNYLKSRTPEDIQLLHELAVKIFEHSPHSRIKRFK